jgi:hypothetical protein
MFKKKAQHMDAVQIAVEQIDVIRRLVEKYPLYLSLASTAEGEDLPLLVDQSDLLFKLLSLC